MAKLLQLVVAALVLLCVHGQTVNGDWNLTFPGRLPNITEGGGLPPPASYMVDNEHNYFQAAPDKGMYTSSPFC